MAQDISGTLQSVSVEGVPYRCSADIDMTEMLSTYENEMLPTSGRGMLKKTRIVPTRESVSVKANGNEKITLKQYADGLDELKLAYIDSAGNRFNCVGAINIDDSTTAENTVTLKLMPYTDWDFTAAS